MTEARSGDSVKSRGLVRSGDRRGSKQVFGFMNAYQADHTVVMLCRVLDVSPSDYYAWRKRLPSRRKQSDLLLGDRIEGFFRASYCRYGRPNIPQIFTKKVFAYRGKRIARLMRERGIRGVCRQKWVTTTVRDRSPWPAPDLVESQLYPRTTGSALGRRHHVHPTWSGFLYLAVVLDAFSSRIVG